MMGSSLGLSSGSPVRTITLKGSLEAEVRHCYATGRISSTGDYLGGLIGHLRDGRIDGGLWDMETTGLRSRTQFPGARPRMRRGQPTWRIWPSTPCVTWES